MPPPTVQLITNYCNENSIELTPEEVDVAIDLVDNGGQSVSSAVYDAGHPEKPTGG